MTDAEVMKFTGFKKPQSEDKIQNCLSKWIEEGGQTLGVWAVEVSDTKQFVGWAMLKPTDGPDPELGFMVEKSQWGKAYGSEIARILLNKGLASSDVKRVVAVVHQDNRPSIKILEKIGMQQSSHSNRGENLLQYEFVKS